MSNFSHAKGPVKEGQREQVRYPTSVDYVDGLPEMLGKNNPLGEDSAITVANEAKQIASTAKNVADNAVSVANAAKTAAEEAKNIAESSGSNTPEFVVAATEPDDNSYWLCVEEVEDA